MSNPNDYRIIRVFFKCAYPHEDFDKVKVILTQPGNGLVRSYWHDNLTKVELEKFCILYRKGERCKIAKIIFGYHKEAKRLFVVSDSYRYENTQNL